MEFDNPRITIDALQMKWVWLFSVGYIECCTSAYSGNCDEKRKAL